MLTNIGNIWQKWSLNIVKISAQKITITYLLFMTNSADVGNQLVLSWKQTTCVRMPKHGCF